MVLFLAGIGWFGTSCSRNRLELLRTEASMDSNQNHLLQRENWWNWCKIAFIGKVVGEVNIHQFSLWTNTMIKIRHTVSLVKSFRLHGYTSPVLRKALFSSFVLPLFIWVYSIFPLLIENQRNHLSDFYCTSLRRALLCLNWDNELFSFALAEKIIIDRYVAHWNMYLVFISNSTDENLLFEKANRNEFCKS